MAIERVYASGKVHFFSRDWWATIGLCWASIERNSAPLCAIRPTTPTAPTDGISLHRMHMDHGGL
jgi:hypothetical protein